ncbi:MAG: radical SAM protein [Acidobacteriota bacterium]|nr:MAG: radical SAM protein [Acidobacteriota bacterium]
MKKLDVALAARMAARGTANYAKRTPLAVSFELTHSCTCNCLHCDHGGLKPREEQITAEDYRKLERKLKPILLQLSGGEPLLRPDFFDIVDAVKEDSGMPYLIVVSNASRLTEEIYLKALDHGVNQFSISLDFPDERHDEFRKFKGLYNHLSDLIPKLTRHGHNNIVMNTAITRWNLPYLEGCYEKAKEWGANISFSAYSAERTKNQEYNISAPEDLELLRKSIDRLLEIKSSNGRIVNSDWTLTGTYEFFKNGGAPGCKAGERYMVVNPDGTMRPCSMFDLKFKSREEMVEQFVKGNTCGSCYVSIRAYLSESYWKMLSDNVRERVLKSGETGC